MAIKKKTKAQKDKDIKDLEKAVNKLIEATQNFQRSMWECEFDVEWIRIKDINNIFNSANHAENVKMRVKQTHVCDDYEDLKDKDHDHVTHKMYYK